MSLFEDLSVPNSDLLPYSSRSTKNQLVLEASIMELSNWVEQHGAADAADNVRGTLDSIDKNEEFIKLTLAVLMAPECPALHSSAIIRYRASYVETLY